MEFHFFLCIRMQLEIISKSQIKTTAINMSACVGIFKNIGLSDTLRFLIV